MLTRVDVTRLPSYEIGMEKGREDGLKKGVQQGMKQGLEQGLEQGWARMLLRRLRLGFGDLPKAAEQWVGAATEAELLRWSEWVLTSDHLNDAF